MKIIRSYWQNDDICHEKAMILTVFTNNMKNKITLTHIDHHNVKRMEYFLNALKIELKEIHFDWKSINLSDQMSGGARFVSTSTETPVTITVYLCSSYGAAAEIAKA